MPIMFPKNGPDPDKQIPEVLLEHKEGISIRRAEDCEKKAEKPIGPSLDHQSR